MANMNTLASAVGRVLMSVIFILAGLQKLAGFSGTAGYMGSLGLPLPEVAVIVAIIVEIIGGVLVLVGYRTRIVGLVLAVWCLVTALIAHTHFSDPAQAVNFLKNLAMAGGFLQLFAYGGGAWSIDGRAASGGK